MGKEKIEDRYYMDIEQLTVKTAKRRRIISNLMTMGLSAPEMREYLEQSPLYKNKRLPGLRTLEIDIRWNVAKGNSWLSSSAEGKFAHDVETQLNAMMKNIMYLEGRFESLQASKEKDALAVQLNNMRAQWTMLYDNVPMYKKFAKYARMLERQQRTMNN